MQVPLDFLMYLYTPMHYCSKGCNNAVAAGSTYPSVLQTFESSNGLYGDAMAATSVRSDGLQGPGTGQCRLCGGGGSLEPFYNLGYKVRWCDVIYDGVMSYMVHSMVQYMHILHI